MKRLYTVILCLTIVSAAFAQRAITGTLADKDTSEPLAAATVKLLKADSSFVSGVTTSANGRFRLKAPRDGKYIIKVTSVGYKPLTRSVAVSGGKDVALQKLAVAPDAIMLKGATVTSHVAKVTVKEDTLVYNAEAYRTPEGSVVEELVKRLPGAVVSDDGKITINGKEVKKILVDGKEFMTGDTQTAMKNLPTAIINNVKAYDQKSDLARVSGIDDGDETTVIDFGIKPGMNKGTITNTDLAAGTKSRYAARSMVGAMSDKMRVMGFLNANNTGDRGFPGGGGGGRFGGGSQGLRASKMVGLNFNFEKKDTLKFDGSVRWNHNDGDALTKSSTENFVATTGSFSNSLSQNYTRGNQWNAQMRLEWTPDTMTNILFRPTFSYSTNDGLTRSNQATYDEDPLLYVSGDPLADQAIQTLSDRELMVNTRRNNNISYSDSKSLGGTLQLNRKLNSTGRNITLRLKANYGESGSTSLATNNVHLFNKKDVTGADSTYQTNRYNLTPKKNYSYAARLQYSEPIAKATYLQFSYEFQYKYTRSDRSTYDFSNLGEDYFGDVLPGYRRWDDYLDLLAHPYEDYIDKDLSRFSEYKNYIHELALTLRIIRKKYNFNIGVNYTPQRTNFIQNYHGVSVDTVRTVSNITPTADFRMKFSKQHQLRFMYRGYTEQPSMTDLLAIRDDSDPLNITEGNPGLKPSFTNFFRLMYNNYIQDHNRAVSAFISYNNTSNSIAQLVTYDPETGGRTSRPENINGNWNTAAHLFLSTSIDSAGYFNTDLTSRFQYTNSVGWLDPDRTAQIVKNTSKSYTVYERLAASYRNEWLEIELNGAFNYDHSRNQYQQSSDLDTWKFSYGGSVNLTFPWGMRLATDMNMNSRRGYSDATLNTNELIWNAQLSQSFLRSKALTVSLQVQDILGRQSTFSRSIDAMRRSDTEYNAITQYGMMHVIYRFNAFGGKAGRQAGKGPGPGGRDGFRPGPGMPPPPGGGGFGGGRRGRW